MRFLAAPPEVPMLRWEHELPEPCVLHPEEVDTYPWAEDDTLPASLIARIDVWDDAQVAEHGPDAPGDQYDLSIPPGWRVGGYPSWASTGPTAIDCASCSTPVRLLSTAEGYEMDAGSHSWVPLEDRDPALRGKASIRGGQSVAQPTRLRFGRDRDLHEPWTPLAKSRRFAPPTQAPSPRARSRCPPEIRDRVVDRRPGRAPHDLRESVLGAGQADPESFGVAEPAFSFGFSDAGDEVVADLFDAGALVRVRPEGCASDTSFSGLSAERVIRR